MGIIDLPHLHMYWEEEWRQKYVVDAFFRKPFEELPRYFHIAEPTPVGVQRNVVEKIAPLHDHCLAVFPEYFTPPEILTLDETMVRFKGQSPWRTVIPGKPTPIGYSMYTMATHGYLLIFDIYRGKGEYKVKQGALHHTVVELIRRWSGSNRVLFLNNLHTSPALCSHLLTMGICCCGTFRPNRSHLSPEEGRHDPARLPPSSPAAARCRLPSSSHPRACATSHPTHQHRSRPLATVHACGTQVCSVSEG